MDPCPAALPGLQATIVTRPAECICDAMGVLAKLDGELLGRYCRAWSRYRTAADFIDKNGLVYPVHDAAGKAVGFTAFPQVAIVERCETALLKMEAQFGIGPASRPRLQTVKPEKPAHGNSARSYFR